MGGMDNLYFASKETTSHGSSSGWYVCPPESILAGRPAGCSEAAQESVLDHGAVEAIGVQCHEEAQ